MNQRLQLKIIENKFYYFLPTVNLTLYIIFLTGIVVLIAFFITKEFFLLILVIPWLLYINYQIYIFIKLLKKKEEILHLSYDGQNLTVIYQNKKKKINIKNAKAFLIYRPNAKNQKKNYTISCFCKENERILAEKLSPGLLVRKNLNKIKNFILNINNKIDIVIYGPEDS